MGTLLPVLQFCLKRVFDYETLSHNMANVPSPADWRDLARQVQSEKDPHKMIQLAEQLIVKLEEEMRRVVPASHGD